MKFLRADDEIDVRHSAQQRFAARLRHAAEKTEHHFRRFFARCPSIPIFPSAFCSAMSRTLHVFSKHDVRFRFVRGRFIAARDQRMRDLFRVALVHLAAVGLDEKFRHDRERNSGINPRSAPRREAFKERQFPSRRL